MKPWQGVICSLLLSASVSLSGCGKKQVILLPSDQVPTLVSQGNTYHAGSDSICMSLGTYKKVFDGCAEANIPVK